MRYWLFLFVIYCFSINIFSNQNVFICPYFWLWQWQYPWEQSEKQQEPINSFILTLGREGRELFRLLPLKWFLFFSSARNTFDTILIYQKKYIECTESRQTLHTSHRITRRFLMKVNILRLFDLNVKLGDTARIIPAGHWMIFFSWVTDFNFTSCQFWGITLTHCVTSHTKHAIGKWPSRRDGESKINFSLYLVNILDVNSKSNVKSWCRFYS